MGESGKGRHRMGGNGKEGLGQFCVPPVLLEVGGAGMVLEGAGGHSCKLCCVYEWGYV